MPLISAVGRAQSRSTRAVAFLAEKLGRAGFVEDFLVAIDRQLPPGLALPIFQRLHVVVETFDRDAAVLVVQSREQLSQRRDRIRDRAAENTRVQIHLRAGDLNLERGHAAEAVAQGRHPTRDHSGIGNERDIAVQRVAIVAQESRQTSAADFLFAFDDEMQVHGQVALLFHRLLEAEDVREDLAFVVCRTAREDEAVFQDWIERRRIPEFERIGRLHIVVTVNHHGLAAGLMLVFRPDDRMAGSGNELRFEADAVEFFDEPVRAFADVFGVGVVGRDARESKEGEVLIEVILAHEAEANVRERSCHAGRSTLGFAGEDSVVSSASWNFAPPPSSLSFR